MTETKILMQQTYEGFSYTSPQDWAFNAGVNSDRSLADVKGFLNGTYHYTGQTLYYNPEFNIPYGTAEATQVRDHIKDLFNRAHVEILAISMEPVLSDVNITFSFPLSAKKKAEKVMLALHTDCGKYDRHPTRTKLRQGLGRLKNLLPFTK